MNRTDGSPMIFGAVTINKDFSVIDETVQANELFRHHSSVVLYQSGQSSEIHKWYDDTGLTVIFGRIFHPCTINSYIEEKSENVNRLRRTDLQDIEGSFIIFRIKKIEDKIKIECSTDKFGSRRLLYSYDKNKLIFATHKNGLDRLCADQRAEQSDESLLEYYNFGKVLGNRTLFRKINKLPCATTMDVENGQIKFSKYWKLSNIYEPRAFRGVTMPDASKDLDDRIYQATRKRIQGLNVTAVALSGGVDSGYLAQKIVQAGGHTVGYNLSFRDGYSEDDRVKELSGTLGIQVNRIVVDPEQLIENFQYVSSISSEPMGFNGAIMRFVALAAKKDGIDTLFDGDGTDRLFLGMVRHMRFQRLIRLFYTLRKMGLAPAVTGLMGRFRNPELRKLYIHFQNWQHGLKPYPERNMADLDAYDPEYERRVYEMSVKPYWDRFEKEFPGGDIGLYFSFQAIQMCPDMFFYDAADVQNDVGTFPIQGYWDDRVVSLAISIPTKMKIHKGYTKYILRKAAALNLNEEYWMMPKIGLQDSFVYTMKSPAGKKWYEGVKRMILDSDEYRTLSRIVPGGKPDPARLVSLAVWKQQHGLA